MNDYVSLADCLTDESGGLGPNCGGCDADADSDVDLVDLGAFAAAFNVP